MRLGVLSLGLWGQQQHNSCANGGQRGRLQRTRLGDRAFVAALTLATSRSANNCSFMSMILPNDAAPAASVAATDGFAADAFWEDADVVACCCCCCCCFFLVAALDGAFFRRISSAARRPSCLAGPRKQPHAVSSHVSQAKIQGTACLSVTGSAGLSFNRTHPHSGMCKISQLLGRSLRAYMRATKGEVNKDIPSTWVAIGQHTMTDWPLPACDPAQQTIHTWLSCRMRLMVARRSLV